MRFKCECVPEPGCMRFSNREEEVHKVDMISRLILFMFASHK